MFGRYLNYLLMTWVATISAGTGENKRILRMGNPNGTPGRASCEYTGTFAMLRTAFMDASVCVDVGSNDQGYCQAMGGVYIATFHKNDNINTGKAKCCDRCGVNLVIVSRGDDACNDLDESRDSTCTELLGNDKKGFVVTYNDQTYCCEKPVVEIG